MPASLLALFYKMSGHAIGVLTAGGALAAVDFRNQVTLGSIIVAAIVIVVAGLFTIRSKIAKVWREEAEGEKAAKERLQSELIAERADRAAFEKEQSEIRAELRGTIADLAAQLKVLEAKTDLTAALTAIRQMNEILVDAVSAAIRDGLEERDGRTHGLLEEIRDKLPAGRDATKEGT